MKKSVLITIFLLGAALIHAEVFPQSGAESYMGANHYFSLSAWSAIRIPLRPGTSLIFKYFQTHIQYQYESFDETTEQFITRTSKNILSNGTTVLYWQKKRWTLFQAVSIVFGKNGYFAAALSSGCTYQVWKWLAMDLGIYLLNETSTLWYPEEESRRIALLSGNGGLQIKFTEWLSVRGRFHIYRNSDKINAYSYTAGLEVNPRYPYCLTFQYSRYSESSAYRFAGDYFSLGLNLYY